MARLCSLAVLLVAALLACARATTFSETSDDADTLQQTIDQFTARLGTQNANEPVALSSGFRKINWDAAPDSASEPNQFPSTFFNFNEAPRARGIEFFVPDDSDALFISSTVSTTPALFGDSGLRAFSESRIFGVRNNGDGDVFGTIIAHFFLPDVQREHGWTRGLGVVFTGVSDDDSEMVFYDEAQREIERLAVPANSDGFSFVGYVSDDADIYSVTIVCGNAGDTVAIDDVFFGEPQRRAGITLFSKTGEDTAAIEGRVEIFRTLVGTLNSPDPVCAASGRRQINWDAAPATVSGDEQSGNLFPGDFFNADVSPRARGIEFSTAGDKFQLSATAVEDASNVVFGRDDIFQTFSPERLFTPLDSTSTDVNFFLPCDNAVRAASRALGIVFVNVRGAETTYVDIHTDDDDEADLVLPVLPGRLNGPRRLSFTSVHFSDASTYIRRARIRTPTADIAGSSRAVVMDDFIFGEPQDELSASASVATVSGASPSSAAPVVRLSLLAVAAAVALLLL